MSRLPPVLDALLHGQQPRPEHARAFMDRVMNGHVDDTQLTAVLTSLHHVPPSAATLAAFARAIRGHMVTVPTEGPVLDTCGTGGSGLSTANTSTMAAFVVAACGVRVAKHGNRASSGKCGSSDLLDALGVSLRVGPDRAAQLLESVGLAFLFAPAYHPAFRHVGPLRKRLGFRTVFNLLGPLCNPAGADHQLLGVSDPSLAERMAGALQLLGSKHVLIAHGHDGLDELTTTGPSTTWTLSSAGVCRDTLHPGQLDIPLAAPHTLQGGDIPTNVAIFHSVLAGERSPHAHLVALNAAAALHVAQRAPTLHAALDLARDALTTGAARDCFERYRAAA